MVLGYLSFCLLDRAKDLGPGVLTAAETGSAVAKLEAKIAASRAHAISEEMQQDVMWGV